MHDDRRNNNGVETSLEMKNVKRNKRSRSSTRVEKEKNDEKGSKVLRKNGALTGTIKAEPTLTRNSYSSCSLSRKATSSNNSTLQKETPTNSLKTRKKK